MSNGILGAEDTAVNKSCDNSCLHGNKLRKCKRVGWGETWKRVVREGHLDGICIRIWKRGVRGVSKQREWYLGGYSRHKEQQMQKRWGRSTPSLQDSFFLFNILSKVRFFFIERSVQYFGRKSGTHIHPQLLQTSFRYYVAWEKFLVFVCYNNTALTLPPFHSPFLLFSIRDQNIDFLQLTNGD